MSLTTTPTPSPVVDKKAEGVKVDSPKNVNPISETQTNLNLSHEVVLRMQNIIEGQLALLVEDNDSEMIAVPLNLYNKSGRVILSIERNRLKREIWGTRFGHWAVIDRNSMASPEYPLGLGVLVSANKLFVSKHIYSSKETSGDTYKEIFLVRNHLGDLVFCAKERVNIVIRHSIGKSKQIDFKLLDAFKREIVFCRKLLRFTSCMSSCCLQRMEVMAQPSKQIGIVSQKWSPIRVEFIVEDHKQNQLFRVKSIKSGMRFKCQEFDIFSMDNKTIGQMRPSLREDTLIPAKEMPILSIEYKENVDPIQKTLLMSAMFLIKSLYFD